MIKPALQDDAFVADVYTADDNDPWKLRIWWLGQSGFLVRAPGGYLLFDPYLSDSLTRKYAGSDRPHVRISERVVAPDRLWANVVFSTHNHTDHLDAETLNALLVPPQCTMIIPEANRSIVAERLKLAADIPVGLDVGGTITASGCYVYAVPAAHPDLATDAQGRHLYLGYVIKSGPFIVYHSGDTVAHEAIVAALRPLPWIDVAFLPINGKLGNMTGVEAARFAKQIGARVAMPCHYDMFEFNTADPYDQFVPECERIGQVYRVLKLGERFTYAREKP